MPVTGNRGLETSRKINDIAGELKENTRTTLTAVQQNQHVEPSMIKGEGTLNKGPEVITPEIPKAPGR